MSKREVQSIRLVMLVIVIAVVIGSLYFTMLSSISPTATSISTQEDDLGAPIGFYTLNITVTDSNDFPINNAFVVVFSGSYADSYTYTDVEGQVSFQVTAGTYDIKAEKYHYIPVTKTIEVSEDTSEVIPMQMEETTILGVIPSWMIMLGIGVILLAFVFLGRDMLNIGSWKKPFNLFSRAREGSWTFLDKSTKTILYGIAGIFLAILLIIIIPNFPTLQSMALYYIALGVISLVALFLEGMNKKYWIAAIGFGKSKNVSGDIVIGVSFALLFVSLTGLFSTLQLFSAPFGSLLYMLLIVVIVSFFEENFFGGILLPTLTEKAGIVPGVLFTSALFMFGHGLAYGWALVPLVFALVFRVVASIIILYRKSWLGTFIAHAIVNVLSVIAIMMYAG